MENLRIMPSVLRQSAALLSSLLSVAVFAGAASSDQMKGVRAEKGFEVTLFAAPPDVGYPVCLSAAPTGELFVAVDENGSLDRAPNRGRVVRCVDSTGSGKADKFTVFCKVDSPRGLFFDNNELIVLHPPMVEAWYDDAGTGVANRHETLISGLGFGLDFRGADHTTNEIRAGIDGWLYVAMGDYGSPNAVGKDGSHLKHRGGGIVRFRSDGSEVEMYAYGTRNVCDISIDPYMNVFEWDNTNDGDGWWVRFTHIIQSGNYGYPMLYMNFADEEIAPLADYGGGAPTGSLYVFEPGLAKDYGDTLYMCEWGQDKIIRHPIQPNGATFKAPQQKPGERIEFLHITRPTDLDVDGQSRLYVSSWKGATFNYAGPNAGFIVRVTDPTVKRPPFPNLKTASDADLLKYMTVPSSVYHLHTQREILRRGVKPAFTDGLTKIAESDANLAAAIYTLKQLLGEKAKDILVKFAAKDELREHALRALTDRKKECAGLDLKLFTTALKDPNPRVRNQALISLGRIGKPEAADAMIPLLADSDPVIVHIAVNNLIELNAQAAAFKALDSGDPKLRNGAIRTLQGMHTPEVVAGLIQRVDKTGDPYQKQAVLKGLCRLYNKEEEWDGKKWWTTRPDTTGPYYTPVTWEKSDEIGKTLKYQLSTADADTKRFLVTEMPRNRIEMPEVYDTLFKLAAEDPAFKSKAVAVLLGRRNLPPEAIPFVVEVASSSKEDPALRAKAIRGLTKNSSKGMLEAAFKAAASVDASNKDVLSAREDFVRDNKNERQANFFAGKASSGSAAERQLAYSVLIYIRGGQKTPQQAKDAANKAIDAGWSSTESLGPLVRAATDMHAKDYADKVREALAKNPSLADAKAAQGLIAEKKDPNKITIEKMKYEDVLAAAQTEKGDAATGELLFKSQALNCIACHTVNKADPPKGPYLGDIANRYKRPELIESILKPNAKIAQGFETVYFKTHDGLIYTGFVVKDAGNTVEIRTSPTEQLTLQTKDIALRKTKEGVSIMPEGLVKDLSVHELASILAYLEHLNELSKK